MSKVLTAALSAVVALTVAGCGSQGGHSAHAASSGASTQATASQHSRTTHDSSSSSSSSSKDTSNDTSRGRSKDTSRGTSEATDKAEASKAVARSFMAPQAAGGGDQLMGLGHKAAACIGVGVVQKLGIRKLERYGVLSEHKGNGGAGRVQLPPTDAKATTDVLFKCVDVAGMIWKAVDKGGQIPVSIRPCVHNALDEKALRPVFAQYFEGHAKVAQKSLTQPIMACARRAGG